MYGFGAKLPPYYNVISNCFSCNNNYFDPLISGGIYELIRAYKYCLNKIKMHGPTRLSELIEQTI